MPDVSSVVMFSTRPDRTIAFYRSIGVNLADEDHGDGRVHAAADLGPVHLAVFRASEGGVAPGRRAGGSTFVGFYVDSLDQAVAALAAMSAPLLSGHETQDWGCRVVVEDPDGRAVEINQRAHCLNADPD
jgi:lactoylglutathione lyase